MQEYVHDFNDESHEYLQTKDVIDEYMDDEDIAELDDEMKM